MFGDAVFCHKVTRARKEGFGVFGTPSINGKTPAGSDPTSSATTEFDAVPSDQEPR